MPDLSPDAVAHLWTVLQIVGVFIFVFSTLIVGLWRGFRWLKEQIKETADAMMAPLAKGVHRAEAKADAAHRRMDRIRSELKLPPDSPADYGVIE